MTKSEDIVIQEFRDEKSMELFDKPECLLEPFQIIKLDQYIYDIGHPVWKPILINNKDSGYRISNIGTVMNPKGLIISPWKINSGYMAICIYVNSKRIRFLIHRLVATAFIPNPENKPQVNHINSNKLFNWVGNLEWSTGIENMNHAKNNNLLHPSLGEHSPFAKHSSEQIEMACKLMEENLLSLTEISKITGVLHKTLDGIKNKGKWKSISSKYRIPSKMNSITRSDSFPKETRDKIIFLYNTGVDRIHIANELKLITRADKLKLYRLINKIESSTTIP